MECHWNQWKLSGFQKLPVIDYDLLPFVICLVRWKCIFWNSNQFTFMLPIHSWLYLLLPLNQTWMYIPFTSNVFSFSIQFVSWTFHLICMILIYNDFIALCFRDERARVLDSEGGFINTRVVFYLVISCGIYIHTYIHIHYTRIHIYLYIHKNIFVLVLMYI